MSQRKILTDRQPEADTLLVMMQREIIPYIKQTGKIAETVAPAMPMPIVGSRSGAPIFILEQVLEVLGKAGVIIDGTTA